MNHNSVNNHLYVLIIPRYMFGSLINDNNNNNNNSLVNIIAVVLFIWNILISKYCLLHITFNTIKYYYYIKY